MVFLLGMGGCSISDLDAFFNDAYGIRIVESMRFIFTNDADDNQALGGSNITVECLKRHENIGGPLTIICTEANSWTPFPQCVSTMTTTAPPAQCPYTEDMLTFQNGYLSNTDGFVIYNGNTATGNRHFFLQ